MNNYFELSTKLVNMKFCKEIPPWFNVNNYRDSVKFTAKDWVDEISSRKYYLNILNNSEENSNLLFKSNYSSEEFEVARNFFCVLIKKQPLVSKKHDLNNPYLEEILESFKNLTITESEYKRMYSSVKEINEYCAYSFLLDSDKKTEIEHDLLFSCNPTNFKEYADHMILSIQAERKYMKPISNHEMYEGRKFLEIDIHASDAQILYEFNIWLKELRSSSIEFVRNQFSLKDFQDWHASRLLAYWDLTTIANIEKFTIPYHVLGNALFPEETNVDITEKIRKVIKKKCQWLFSKEVFNALKAQARAEDIASE